MCTNNFNVTSDLRHRGKVGNFFRPEDTSRDSQYPLVSFEGRQEVGERVKVRRHLGWWAAGPRSGAGRLEEEPFWVPCAQNRS